MLPALISTMASTGISCSAETARRMASNTAFSSSGLRLRPRSISATMHQPLATAHVDREGGAGDRSQQRMRLLDGLFDVLRIMIPPMHDQQILQAGR